MKRATPESCVIRADVGNQRDAHMGSTRRIVMFNSKLDLMEAKPHQSGDVMLRYVRAK